MYLTNHTGGRWPLLDRRGAEHIKRFCAAIIACEAGWWFKFDKILSILNHHPVCGVKSLLRDIT